MSVMKYHSRQTYSRGLHFERDVEIWDECWYNYILSFNVLNKKCLIIVTFNTVWIAIRSVNIECDVYILTSLSDQVNEP